MRSDRDGPQYPRAQNIPPPPVSGSVSPQQQYAVTRHVSLPDDDLIVQCGHDQRAVRQVSEITVGDHKVALLQAPWCLPIGVSSEQAVMWYTLW